MTSNRAENYAWLADAIGRRIAATVASYRTHGEITLPEAFEGLNETATVVHLGRIFEGLGFVVYYEQRVFEQANWRLDLWAAEFAAPTIWMVEAKVLYDGDMRLGRSRFAETQELVGDLTRLADLENQNAKKVGVWLAFSKAPTLEGSATPGGKLKLLDAVDLALELEPRTSLDSVRTVGLRDVGPCTDDAAYAHVLCWHVD